MSKHQNVKTDRKKSIKTSSRLRMISVDQNKVCASHNALLHAVVPSQVCVLQSASSVCRPMQMSPPLAGGGLLHVRVRW